MLDNRYFNDNFVAGLLMDIYFPEIYFFIAWNGYIIYGNFKFCCRFANGYIFCRNINFFICLITDILMTILLQVC